MTTEEDSLECVCVSVTLVHVTCSGNVFSVLSVSVYLYCVFLVYVCVRGWGYSVRISLVVLLSCWIVYAAYVCEPILPLLVGCLL